MIAETSIASLKEITAELPRRREFVLSELARHRDLYALAPTAYELLEFINAARPDWAPEYDLNDVRPRLTELKQRGQVKVGAKVKCGVTGRTAYTWEVA